MPKYLLPPITHSLLHHAHLHRQELLIPLTTYIVALHHQPSFRSTLAMVGALRDKMGRGASEIPLVSLRASRVVCKVIIF